MNLQADPKRADFPETGVYVRAMNVEGKWDSIDISRLKADSLRHWLASKPDLAEKVLLTLLHYEWTEEKGWE
jgi:hypothetical protein